MNSILKSVVKALAILFLLSLAACSGGDEAPATSSVISQTTSNAPLSTNNRSNTYLGCIETSQRSVSYSVWDHGTVDGDIISLYSNGSSVLSNFTLTGSAHTGSFTLPNNGFNHIVYYAHNLGLYSPNTGTITINGTSFVMEANLTANGYVDIVVTGTGVRCPSSTSTTPTTTTTTTPTTTTTTTPTTGQLVVWSSKTTMNTSSGIAVKIDGVLTGYLTNYWASAPACGATGAVTKTLTPGTHYVSGVDGTSTWASTPINVVAGTCSTFNLY